MRRNKSAEDIRIPIQYSCATPDVNCNFIITNLLKSKPVHRIYQNTHNAYQFLQKEKQNKSSNDQNQIVQIRCAPKKNKRKRAVSQQDLDNLMYLEDEFKTLAFQTLCNQLPIKTKLPHKINAKHLHQADLRTLEGKTKNIQMTKRVMVNAIQRHRKPQLNENFKQSSELSSQSISSQTSMETSKNSMISELNQKSKQKQTKNIHFNKILQNKQFSQVYNTERRKQAWKGYHQAERTSIKMKKPGYGQNTHITFLNNESDKQQQKKKKKVGFENEEQLNEYMKVLKSFKQLQSGFENYASQFKIRLK